jgi:glycosyltransferase involved in cell wall biosynthesis
MKILITSSLDLEKSLHSRLHQFIDYLSTKNHEIVVLSIKDYWKDKQTKTNKMELSSFCNTLKNIKIYYFTEKKVDPYLQELLSFRTINRLLDEVDYKTFDVHIAADTFVSGYLVAKKMKRAGINTIYDTADNMPEMIKTSPQIPKFLRFPGYFVGKAILKRNIEVAQKIIVSGEILRKSLNIPIYKAEIVPNGVDINEFSNSSSEKLKEELGISSDFVIGYVGALREWVDLKSVFSAIKHLYKKYSEIRMLVVGAEGYFEENKNLAKDFDVEDKVIFTGQVPYDEIPRYISCMDVCVLPFKKNRVTDDSCPLKLFEYMACEKPVISAKLSEVENIVQNRILYASNSEEYKSGIIELYNNEGLRGKMGLEGRRFVEENYDWKKLASKFEKVLLEVT